MYWFFFQLNKKWFFSNFNFQSPIFPILKCKFALWLCHAERETKRIEFDANCTNNIIISMDEIYCCNLSKWISMQNRKNHSDLKSLRLNWLTLLLINLMLISYRILIEVSVVFHHIPISITDSVRLRNNKPSSCGEFNRHVHCQNETMWFECEHFVSLHIRPATPTDSITSNNFRCSKN